MTSLRRLAKKLRAPGPLAVVTVLVVGTLWALAYPERFLSLWLTPDQQGWLLFQRGHYAAAAQRFSDPRWRGMALYAAQDFEAAAQYFSQYQDAASLLARGNALAHAREYLPARAVYRELARRYPDNEAAAVNLAIVQRLIDANRELSESQAGDVGELSAGDEEGPRSSEGDERTVMQEREQYSAAQLLADDGLTQMWLRQVQRDPAEFLANKFYRQLETREAAQ